MSRQTWRNWSDSAAMTPRRTVHPRSVDDLQSVVAEATAEGLRVKAPGAGHSFTPIAVTDGVMVSSARLNDVVSVDAATGLVTVEAGMTLRRLNPILHSYGLALPNLGDIDGQTIAGAIATGTHGTGIRRQGIAAAVTALDIVLADGSLVSCSERDEPALFAAGRVGLGAVGVVGRVTLQCVPAFLLHAIEAPMPLDLVLDNLDDLVDDNDHFEFYWFPHTTLTSTRRNNRVPAETPREPLSRTRAWVDDGLLANTVFGWVNRVATRHRSWVPRINQVSARALTRREYIDDSYRVFVSPRRVPFREMEWAVPRDRIRDVLGRVRRWLDRARMTVSFPIEVRFSGSDDIWMSTGFERENAYIAVHQYVAMEYEPYFSAVEAIASAEGGRPHWGKIHHLGAGDLRPRYPRFDDFLDVRARVDPGGAFSNPYLDRVLGRAESPRRS
jgi:FAD-linked oxidoreductase